MNDSEWRGPVSQLRKVYAEEKALGFAEDSALRLVGATLNDAGDGPIRRSMVRSVRATVEYLDDAMRRRAESETTPERLEQLRAARALTPGLVGVLDCLLGQAPHQAWARFRSLQAGAHLGLL